MLLGYNRSSLGLVYTLFLNVLIKVRVKQLLHPVVD
jgi:hypothetical protein